MQNISTNHLQLSFFDTVDPAADNLRKSIKDVDVNAMTPVECMLKLIELKKIISDS